jgi:hypothetical protein
MVVAEFKNDNYTSVYGLKQWDFGQELLIKGTGIQGKTVEVHFALERDDVALRMLGTVENGNITVLIPDTLLQVGNSIYAYVYQSEEMAGKTTHKIFMHVSPRAKPEDYTEKEFKNALQQVLTIAQSVREDADAGKFNATDEQIRKVVETYMSNHPIEKIETDKTLSIEGQAADAKATGDKILQYAIKNTVSGESPLTITDSAEENLQDIKLLGKSEQTQMTGAQLIPFPYVDKDTTKNGVTFTVKEDGGIKVYGTSTETVTFVLATIDYGTESIFNNGTGNGKIISGGKDNVSIEYHGVTKKTYLSIAPGKAVDVVIYPQLQNGSTATPYEPYTGGQPSPNPEYPQEIKNSGKYNEDTGKYEVDVKLTGKNLYNTSIPYTDGVWIRQDGEIVNGVDARTSDYIPVIQRKYAFQFDVANVNPMYINGYDKDKFFVKVVGEISKGKGIANINDKTIKYIRVSLTKKSTKIQLEMSDVFTDYEPYREPKTVKLSLDQPLRGTGKYKDEITKDGIIRRVWSEVKNTIPSFLDFDTNGNYKLAFDPKKPLKDDGVYKIPCDITTNMISYINNSSIYWLPKAEELQSMGVDIQGTAKDARTKILEYLSKNPMTIQYALKKPIIEPLPEEFEQFLKLNSYYPTTVISTYGGEVDPGVEVTYVADTKNYIDNKVSTNVANIISQYQTNISNLLSLMPLSVQARMVETDVNNILENMEEIKHE